MRSRCGWCEGAEGTKTAAALGGVFAGGIALVARDAEHFVDDVGVDGCRLLGGCRGLEELREVGLDWWCDW